MDGVALTRHERYGHYGEARQSRSGVGLAQACQAATLGGQRKANIGPTE
jgi:hypothetical protein